MGNFGIIAGVAIATPHYLRYGPKHFRAGETKDGGHHRPRTTSAIHLPLGQVVHGRDTLDPAPVRGRAATSCTQSLFCAQSRHLSSNMYMGTTVLCDTFSCMIEGQVWRASAPAYDELWIAEVTGNEPKR